MNLGATPPVTALFEEPSFDFETLPCWPSLEQLVTVDELTGSARAAIPIRITPGRGDFTPHLALVYDSSGRNSSFGWGWNVTLPSISRRTWPEVPRFRDPDDDIYQLESESHTKPEELTPALHPGGGWVEDRHVLGDYLVQRYRRRFETTHDRIERWLHQPSGQMHWRLVDRNNVTSLFGSSDDTRISDPGDPSRVLRWLISERFDDRGNIMRYQYKREDLAGVDVGQPHEMSRRNNVDACCSERYPKRIEYGNSVPHDRFKWHFEVVFDYGEHDTDSPSVVEDRTWSVRPDPYSSHRGSFERRAWRRCRRILMFHRFDELGPEPVLVASTGLEYRELDGVSTLSSVEYSGYARVGGAVETKCIPPLRLRYNRLGVDASVKDLDAPMLLSTLVDHRAGARWIDLDGCALPGVMSKIGTEWQYLRNLGGGKFGDPEPLTGGEHSRVVSEEVIDLRPDAALARSDVEVQRDMMAVSSTGARTTSVAHGRTFVPTTTFRATADVNQDDPFVGYLDLNGDDADDVVVADDHVIRWYPSRGDEGFADPIVLRMDADALATPHRLHSDDEQSFHVADMTGDGLLDLVRVRSTEVVYWPNRGRGRFGEPVTMSCPSTLRYRSGSSHVVLADLTGDGVADLVCVGEGEIRLSMNHAGNVFSDVVEVRAPGIVPRPEDVHVVDLFGTGISNIVWIDRSDVPRLRYVSPFGSVRSGRLSAVSNSLGAEVHISYVTSTESWERDRDAGAQWSTTSATVVDIVERIDVIDDVSATHLTRSCSFRDGYFDPIERRFAGFASCEVIDSDREPFLVRRSWRHIGAMLDGTDVLSQSFTLDRAGRGSWITGSYEDDPEGGTHSAPVLRALRGALLRAETLDVTDGVRHLSSVVEHAWSVRQLQPGRSGRSASYDVHSRECVEVVYGPKGSDPAVRQRLTLEIDEYGSVTREIEVAHAREQPSHPLQAAPHVTLTDRSWINRTEQATWHRFAVPLEEKWWDISIEPREGVVHLRPQELRSVVAAAERRLVRRSRWRYVSNDGARLLDIGHLESKGLLGRREHLAYETDSTPSSYRDVDGAEALLTEAGYVAMDGELWAFGDLHKYDSSRFYQLSELINRRGGRTVFKYESASLRVVETQDPFGNVEYSEPHRRTSKTSLHTDVNGNVRGWRFDALGVLLSSTIVGSAAEPLDRMVVESAEASAHDDPTEVYTYDLDVWQRSGEPSWVRRRARQHHGDPDTSLRDSYEFFDGLGRRVGRAIRRAEGDWLITDLVERDVSGSVVRIATPFVCDRRWPDLRARERALSDATIHTRSRGGCDVRTDFPDGTYSTMSITPWQTVYRDGNDNVLGSRWYRERQDASRGRAGDFGALDSMFKQHDSHAGALAATHAATPVIELLDARRRVIVLRDATADGRQVDNARLLDHFGNVVALIAPDGRSMRTIKRNLLGAIVEVDDTDAGRALEVRSPEGVVIWQQNAEGQTVRSRYDVAGRLTHRYESEPSGAERLVRRLIWGGGETPTPNAARSNLVGACLVDLSTAGMLRVSSRDHRGRVLHELVIPAKVAPDEVDLSAVNTVEHIDEIDFLLDRERPLARTLSSKPLVSTASYDALGNPISRSTLSGPLLSFVTTIDGLVRSVTARAPGTGDERTIASNCEYDEMGRLRFTTLGNGVRVSRTYDSKGLLTRSTAQHGGNEQVLQDSRMTRDAAGNVTSVIEHGHLMASYAYDSAYRPTKVEGWESVVSPTGEREVRRFTRDIEYDQLSNVVTEHHRAGDAHSVTRFSYRHRSHLLDAIHTTGLHEDRIERYRHDRAGRLTEMSTGEHFRWDAGSNLASIELPTGTTCALAYFGDAQGLRRISRSTNGETKDVIRRGDSTRVVTGDDDGVRRDVHATMIGVGGVSMATFRQMVARDEPSQYEIERSVMFHLLDVSGSPAIDLSETGQIVSQRWFSPWGEMLLRRDQLPTPDGPDSPGFAGSWSEADLGLMRLQDEWMVPGLQSSLCTSRSTSEMRWFNSACVDAVKVTWPSLRPGLGSLPYK